MGNALNWQEFTQRLQIEGVARCWGGVGGLLILHHSLASSPSPPFLPSAVTDTEWQHVQHSAENCYSIIQRSRSYPFENNLTLTGSGPEKKKYKKKKKNQAKKKNISKLELQGHEEAQARDEGVASTEDQSASMEGSGSDNESEDEEMTDKL